MSKPGDETKRVLEYTRDILQLKAELTKQRERVKELARALRKNLPMLREFHLDYTGRVDERTGERLDPPIHKHENCGTCDDLIAGEEAIAKLRGEDNNMITFKDICDRVGKTPEEVIEIIKGEYTIDIVSNLPKEPEKLWEKMKAISDKHEDEKTLSGWTEYANVAIDCFLEVVDKSKKDSYGLRSFEIEDYAKKLKAKMEEFR